MFGRFSQMFFAVNLLKKILSVGLLGMECSTFAAKDTASSAALEKKFTATVRPFVETYCLTCHNKEKAKGDFDLSPYTSLSSVTSDFKHWDLALERLEAKEMPPKKAEKHPSDAQRKEIVDWIVAARKFEADRNAGDPGIVLARRLSNSEYDYTIRDLTSVDIHPTKEFPIDPANQAGFDNTGESLTMSPALLKKYLQAARDVSEHLVLKPDGLAFAPHLMMAETDRDKYCILRIVDFYQRQPTDLADYFMAAWHYKNRDKSRQTIAQVAAEAHVSAKYLQTVWDALNAKEDVGPIAKLQKMFTELPARDAEASRAKCVAMRDFVVDVRQKIVPEVKNLNGPGMNPSAQALVLWKDRQWAANRRKYDPALLQPNGVVEQTEEEKNKPASYNRRKVKPKVREVDANLWVPADAADRAKYEAAFARFAAIFPDTFYVKERARAFVDPEEEKANGNVGRLLSAGLHNMTGYFRDDGPLYDMILDESGRKQLDALWDEFNMIAQVPQRMHQSTIYFERTDSRYLMDAEFDFARAEDKDCTSEAKVKKLAELYYAKAQRNGATDQVLAAIKEHFERVWADIDRAEKMAKAAEPKHLESLVQFAERAYRRPLADNERQSLLAFYKNLRAQDGLDHEDAIRDTISSVLMSPNFLYRVDLVAEGKTIRPLDDYALASRLSYFLWSSMPDAELLAHAKAGDLHKQNVLLAQTRRMLRDDRARGLATEFLANWLDFRRFEELNSVDRERFPQFDNALREAMFEEPIRFFLDVVKENRSALDFLYGKYTFVNPALAKHYGMTIPPIATNQWVRIDDAQKFDRGGILPMAVFLTKNAPGLRTSPVKRGNWVVRRVLGEQIPPPPPVVPELPADESKLGQLSLREALAKHRDDPACAGCHARFDSYGLVFEGFGPIGEKRSLDLGGKPVGTRATFADGTDAEGVAGLREYVKLHRENDFLDTVCKQLLAFGLGRTLILSDDSTIREMRAKLAANGNRFDTLVECVVTSPQFLNKRGQESLAKN
jgi:hypothetical protein